MTNPFEVGQPAQQTMATAMGTNPFAPAVPATPAPPQPAPAPAAPNPFVANPASGRPVGYTPEQHVAQSYAQQAAPAYAPPAQQQSAPPALDMSGLRGAPAPVVGEGRGAKLADMYGRLVLVFPLGLARVARNPQYVTPEQRARGDLEKDRMTATVVVLDDGVGGMQPIAFGGAPYALPPTPHTESSPLPYTRKAMWIDQSRLISQLRDSLPQAPGAAPGMVCGRVLKTGPAQNDPWYLQGATEQELALAGQYLQLVQRGESPHPLA